MTPVGPLPGTVLCRLAAAALAVTGTAWALASYRTQEAYRAAWALSLTEAGEAWAAGKKPGRLVFDPLVSPVPPQDLPTAVKNTAFPGWRGDLVAALARAPYDPRLWEQEARVVEESGDRVSDAVLQALSHTGRQLPSAHLQVGDILLGRGDLAGAAIAYRRAFTFDSLPHREGPYFLDLARRGADVATLISSSPDTPVSLAVLAGALLNNRRPATAKEVAGHALRRFPYDEGLLIVLADIHRELGDAAAEESLLRSWLLRNPSSAPALFRMGTLRFETSDPSDTVQWLSKAVASDPDFTRAYYPLGLTYERLGNPEEARRFAKKAADALPTFVDAHLLLARSALALGKVAEARDAVDKAVALQPQWPRVIEMRGRVNAAAANPSFPPSSSPSP